MYVLVRVHSVNKRRNKAFIHTVINIIRICGDKEYSISS